MKEGIILEEKFMEIFTQLRPIVINARKRFKIDLWDLDDYIQEGMIVLHKLLESNPDPSRLPVHFKVKYTHHLTNFIRKEKAAKRTLPQKQRLDINDFAHKIEDKSSQVDTELIVEETKSIYFSRLKEADQEAVEELLKGNKIDRMKKSRLKKKLQTLLGEIENL